MPRIHRYPHLPQGLPIPPAVQRVPEPLRHSRRLASQGRQGGQERLWRGPRRDQDGRGAVQDRPEQGPLQGGHPGHAGGAEGQGHRPPLDAAAGADEALPRPQEHQGDDRAEEGCDYGAAQLQGLLGAQELGLVPVYGPCQAFVEQRKEEGEFEGF